MEPEIPIRTPDPTSTVMAVDPKSATQEPCPAAPSILDMSARYYHFMVDEAYSIVDCG